MRVVLVLSVLLVAIGAAFSGSKMLGKENTAGMERAERLVALHEENPTLAVTLVEWAISGCTKTFTKTEMPAGYARRELAGLFVSITQMMVEDRSREEISAQIRNWVSAPERKHAFEVLGSGVADLNKDGMPSCIYANAVG